MTTPFDFSAEDVAKALRPPSGRKLEYVGSATSHFQAEPLHFDAAGNPVAVSDWELEVAKSMRGERSRVQGVGDVANLPRFLERKEQYVQRSAELGENMFRFSLDFARLCPKEGEFNDELMAEYVKALALIKAHGQEPMLTIYHWPMPRYLLETDNQGNITKGGWEHPDVAQRFRFFIERTLRFLGNEDSVRYALQQEGLSVDAQDKFLGEGLVRYFTSINEPLTILATGYLGGVFPPYKKMRMLAIREVLGKLVEAHDIARNEIKSGKFKGGLSRSPKVGVAHAWHFFDGVFGEAMHSFSNKSIADKFEREGLESDFLGLQYYFRTTALEQLAISAGAGKLYQKLQRGKRYGEHPAFGDVYPSGIYELLKKMRASYPQKEIFITEFGFSDKEDLRRPYWILETVRYVIEALKAGVPVKGMLLWSLVNNFEWNLGMEQKFGLFDESELREPLKRSPKGEIRGWEAWQQLAKAVHDPTPENLRELQSYYETAKAQFERSVGT